MSGELQGDIYDFYTDINKLLVPKVNGILKHGIYGDGISEWSFIAMIFGELGPSWYKEIKRYHKKTKVFEARVIIVYDKFKCADAAGRIALVCQALDKSLDWLEGMKIKDIDVPKLRADFHIAIKDII